MVEQTRISSYSFYIMEDDIWIFPGYLILN